MAGFRLVSAFPAIQCVSSALSWLTKRWTLSPDVPLNGVSPAWLELPYVEVVVLNIRALSTPSQLHISSDSCFLSPNGYANWTSSSWHVRLYGQTYRIPTLAASQIDDLARPFVPGIEYDSMKETMKVQARNLTSNIHAVLQQGIGVEVDFVYNRQSIAKVRPLDLTDGGGESNSFVNVKVSAGTVLNEDQTQFTQGIQLFANGSIVGNARSYFIPTRGLTLVADFNDILRTTRVYDPDD